jgi:hypothetical protein
MKVKILKNTVVPGKNLFKGKSYDLTNDEAVLLVRLGKAVLDEKVEAELVGDKKPTKKSSKTKNEADGSLLLALSDDELKAKAAELEVGLEGNETRDEIVELIEAFLEAE